MEPEQNNNSKPVHPDLPSSLEFDVMPQANGEQAPKITEKIPLNRKTPGQESGSKRSLRVWVISVVTILIIFGIAFGIYVFLTGRSDDDQSPEITVPDQEVQAVDTDEDGLDDEEEKKLATDPSKPDTDSDGLADGDEINIYFSDPLFSDTDLDTFPDGEEVARSFSPVVNTTDPASAEELQSWTERISLFGLHEPTKTTLALSSKLEDTGEIDEGYKNPVFGYSLGVPSTLEFRESQDKTVVGFLVAGTTPDDENVSRDPITISVAVKPAEQSVEEWGATFLQPGVDFETKGAIQGADVNGILYTELQGQVSDCPMNQAHFAAEGDTKVYALSLTCNQLDGFEELFLAIANSFTINN